MTRLHSFHNLKAKTRSDLAQLLRNTRVDTNINISNLAPPPNPSPQSSRNLTPGFAFTVPTIHSRTRLLSNNKYPENSSNIVKSELSLCLDRGRQSALSDSKNSSLSSYNLNRSSSTTPQTLVTSEQQDREPSEEYKENERDFKDETPLPTCLSLESISEGATKTSTFIADSCRNPEASLESSLFHSSTSFASADDGDGVSDKAPSSVHEAHSAHEFSAPNSPAAESTTSFSSAPNEVSPDHHQSQAMSESKAEIPVLPVSTHSATDRTVFTSDKDSAKNGSPSTSPEASPRDMPEASYKPYRSMLLAEPSASETPAQEATEASSLRHQPSVQDLAVTISQNTNTSNETLAKTRPLPASIDTKKAQNLDQEVFTPCSEYSFAVGEEKLICKQDLPEEEDEPLAEDEDQLKDTKPGIKRDTSISNILDAYAEPALHDTAQTPHLNDAQDPQQPQEHSLESIEPSVPKTVIEKQEDAKSSLFSQSPQQALAAGHSDLIHERVPEKSRPEASSNDSTLYHGSPESDQVALDSETDTCKDQSSPMVDPASESKEVLAKESENAENQDIADPETNDVESDKNVAEENGAAKDTEKDDDLSGAHENLQPSVLPEDTGSKSPDVPDVDILKEAEISEALNEVKPLDVAEQGASAQEVTKKPPPQSAGDSPLRRLVAKELENKTTDNTLIGNRLSMLNVVNVDFDKSLPTTPDNMKFTVNIPDSVSPASKKLLSPQKPPMLQRTNSMSKSFSVNNFKKVFGRFGSEASVKDSNELILSKKESFGSRLLKKKLSFSGDDSFSHNNLSSSSMTTQKKPKRKFFKTLKFIPGNTVKEEIPSPVYSVRSKVPSPTFETFSEEAPPVNLYTLPDFETEDDGFLDLLTKFDEVEKKAELEDEQMRNKPKANAFFMRDDELTKAQIADQQRKDHHSSDDSLPEALNENNDDDRETSDSSEMKSEIPWSPGYDDYASGFITPETEQGPRRAQSLKLDKHELQDMLDKKAHSNHFIKHVRQMRDMDLVEIVVEAFDPNEKNNDDLVEPRTMNPILRDTSINKGNPAKAVKFSSKVSISETYPSYVYRRYNKSVTQYYLTENGEVNKIKNELNAYKCYEMLVHEKSQNNTQFFY